MFFTPHSGSRLRFYAAVGFTLFSIASTAVFAQNTENSLSLHDAIEKTLAKNSQLHQFTIKQNGLVGRRELSEQKPALTASIEIENFGGDDDLSGTQSAETTLALSSVIELGGKRRTRVAVADAQLQIFDHHRQAFTLDVLGELTGVFVETLKVQELIALANEANELAQYTHMVVKDRSRQGATSEAEVKRAAAFLTQSQLQVNALQQQHERLLIKLAAYWGETSPKWNQLDGDLYAFGNSSDFKSLYERAQSSPMIAVFASEARLKKAEVSLAKTLATSDLGWQVGVRRFEDNGNTAFTAGVSIPLFGGKRNKGALKSALASENEVAYEHQTALLKLYVQLFEAYSQRQQHVAAVNAYRKTILPNLNAALASTRRAYESGRYSYQDWITAQKESLEAKRALIENAAAASLNQAVIEQLIAEPLNVKALHSSVGYRQ